MSEFERPENDKGKEDCFFSAPTSAVPDDFTEEDLAFAGDLHAFFSPESENLPPYYVQTLLEVDDQRFEPVVRGFEYKTSARVFRRLKLRRRLFCPYTSPLNALSTSMGDASLRRSALAMLGTFALIMLLTVAFTGSSFASGVAILLRGTSGNGVYRTNNYPVGMVHSSHVDPSTPAALSTKQISLFSVRQQLHFPVYWPEYSLPEYTLQHINLYVGLDQQWADGPMLEFEYSLSPAEDSTGTGKIWVREFMPRTDVLQLVEEGASHSIDVDKSGRALAIYVDGQWKPDANGEPIWTYGGRSELIYQINGIVFWIAGSQSDGVAEKELMQIAQGLARYSIAPHMHWLDATPVTQMTRDSSGPFSTDVIIIFPGDSAGQDGPYYLDVTSHQPPKNTY
jgi:hypothetical protein